MTDLLDFVRQRFEALGFAIPPAPPPEPRVTDNPFSFMVSKAASAAEAQAQGNRYASQWDVGHAVADVVETGDGWVSVTLVDTSSALTQFWLDNEADRLLSAPPNQRVTIFLPALQAAYDARKAAQSIPVTASMTPGGNGVGYLGSNAPAGADPSMPGGTVLAEPDGSRWKKVVNPTMFGDQVFWLRVN